MQTTNTQTTNTQTNNTSNTSTSSDHADPSQSDPNQFNHNPRSVVRGVWLSTFALVCLCGFTELPGSDTAWASAAVRQAHRFVVNLVPTPSLAPAQAVPAPAGTGSHLLDVYRLGAHPPTLHPPVLPTATPVQPQLPSPAGMIRYAPRRAREIRMVGGQFQGSDDGVAYTTLYTITKPPYANRWNASRWTAVSVPQDLSRYRFLRYLAPAHSYGNISELEFDSHGVKIVGTAFGTAGSRRNQGNTFANAFDSRFSSYFDAPDPGIGDFVGIDQGAPAAPPPPPVPLPPPPVSLPPPPVPLPPPPVPLPLPPVPLPLPPVPLPLEVMGADGTTQSVQVSVPASAGVTGLWMQAHNLSYADKASVQVNGGAWMPLDNDTAQVLGSAKSYGGIGGGFSTIKLLLPLPGGAVKPGTNTLSFRFNGTDGVSSGFRILAFNLMNASGRPVLPASAFVQDDPSAWQPPMPNPASIAAGQTLWQQGHLVESSVVRSPIHAACADCHTDSGRDLKYFNYSNYSIVQRSQFHGLSAVQGRQIASYIRTLNVPSPGRPWNPPYQPGPSLDSQPVQNWAAGAGINAVLDKDSDMLPYLFPGTMAGGSAQNITASSNSAMTLPGHLNIRELPIAIQLLDWNHWLPTVAPVDAYPDFAESDLHNSYNQLRTLLVSDRTTNLKNGWVAGWIGAMMSKSDSFTIGKDPAFTAQAGPWTPQNEAAVYSLELWKAVKEFEISNEFSLEDADTRQYFYKDPAEPRGWPQFDLFNVSPGKLGIPQSSGVAGNTEAAYELTNNSWYWLQAIVNPGNRQVQSTISPIDWGYMTGRIKDLGNATQALTPDGKGVWEDNRMYALTVLGMQQGDGTGVSPLLYYGWHPRDEADPNMLMLDKTSYANDWHDSQETAAQRQAMLNVLMRQVLTKNRTFTPGQWYNGAPGSTGEILPTDIPFSYGGQALGQDPRTYVNTVYNSIVTGRQLGLDNTLLNDWCTWAATLWPHYNWASLRH